MRSQARCQAACLPSPSCPTSTCTHCHPFSWRLFSGVASFCSDSSVQVLNDALVWLAADRMHGCSPLPVLCTNFTAQKGQHSMGTVSHLRNAWQHCSCLGQRVIKLIAPQMCPVTLPIWRLPVTSVCYKSAWPELDTSMSRPRQGSVKALTCWIGPTSGRPSRRMLSSWPLWKLAPLLTSCTGPASPRLPISEMTPLAEVPAPRLSLVCRPQRIYKEGLLVTTAVVVDGMLWPSFKCMLRR